MKNDVILNQISVNERCIRRIQEVYQNNPSNLMDYTKQGSIILNIKRACEVSSDLGNADENPLHFNGEMVVRPLE
ncbi:hypothetical protein V7266_00155 [Neobacillus drentensis]|uniref:hypothetical protein n=1 Tax=Neobacillus drentensis TaxID=220684 RepID=UPI002FFEC60A